MEAFLLGWAGRRWRPAGVKQVVAVKLVQPRKESRSVTGVSHQVSKKTATRRLKAPDAPRQVPAPQSAAEAVLLLMAGGALLAGMLHRPSTGTSQPARPGAFRCLSCGARVNAQVGAASNLSHRGSHTWAAMTPLGLPHTTQRRL